MARPRLKGLLYFPFDIDFFEDNKIRILKARYKSDGVLIYLFLLCEIYRQGYYIKVDDDFEYIISDELGIDQNKVKQVLNFLLKRSLFDNTLFSLDKVLTSAGIQRRYQLVGTGDGCSKAKTVEKAPSEKERLKAAELLGKRYALFTDKVDIQIYAGSDPEGNQRILCEVCKSRRYNLVRGETKSIKA